MASRRASRPSRAGGFTLIEQIAVLAVLAVLLGAALPTMGRMVGRHELATAQLDLVAALQHARSEAIISRRRTLLCPTRGHQDCADDTHWEYGWAMGHPQPNQASQLDGSPLRVHPHYGRVVILSSSGRKVVRFQPDGTAPGSDATFTLCRRGDPNGALLVKLSDAGRVAGAPADADSAQQCAASR